MGQNRKILVKGFCCEHRLPLLKTTMKKYLLPLAALALLSTPTKAFGHAVETNFLFEDELQIQTLFSHGEPLTDAKVQVFSPENPEEPWLEGTTDEEGRFSFAPDTELPGDWEIVIQEKGHGDMLTVPVDAEGVDVELISDAGEVHMHYMAGPLTFIGAVVAGGAFALRKRMKALMG